METTLHWMEETKTKGWLVGSIALHIAVAGVVVAWAFIGPHTSKWGANDQQAGAIQASMVSSLPLPNTQRQEDKAVLPSEAPSPNPVQTKTATVETPKPDEIIIPTKKPTPKVAANTTPANLHPQPTTVQPKKAVSGETSGTQIPQSMTQTQHGTASAQVQDKAFGSRFAYYTELIQRKVAENWISAGVDPASNGKRVTILFDVSGDGVPSNPRIETASGSMSLDRSGIQAVQRTDGFGPLPPGAGSHITVEYYFDYRR